MRRFVTFVAIVPLVLVVTTGIYGCSGPKGDPGSAGPPGASGADGAVGPAGPVGAAGPAGADGQDGADGTAGANGADGADGADGRDGTDGAVGPAGTSTAMAQIRVVDADSGAVVAGATVMAEPTGDITATTAAGVASFAALPAGFYRFLVVTPTLVASGSDIVAGTETEVYSEWQSLVAGGAQSVDLAVKRIDTSTLNLTTIHAVTGGFYSDSNCTACHGDRSGEVSYAPPTKPFHAMTTHSAQPCTFCHGGGVDLAEESAATIRKQVDISGTCLVCHPNYPTLP